MSELKPTDKGYIEAVSLKYAEERGGDIIHQSLHLIDCRNGYTLSIEHNNVPELIEKGEDLIQELFKRFPIIHIPEQESLYLKLHAFKEALTKAEQNKLNK